MNTDVKELCAKKSCRSGETGKGGRFLRNYADPGSLYCHSCRCLKASCPKASLDGSWYCKSHQKG